MRLVRSIFIWLAMAGLLTPGASGTILCIEADGRIAIESLFVGSDCAPVCASESGDDTGVSTPDECVDLALVKWILKTSPKDPLSGMHAAHLLHSNVENAHATGLRTSGCGEPPPILRATQRSLRSTRLLI